jgi:hypothetical protein
MNPDIKYRLDQAYFTIVKLPGDQFTDLKRIWKNCYTIQREISKEEVNCRRLGKNTVQYTELEAKLLETLDTLEKYITLATLLN